MSEIRQLEYRPPDASRWQVETMPFKTLRKLNDGATQRGDFHVLAVVQRGRGSVAIDFTTSMLGPQTVLSIRPGVVHPWIGIAELVPTAPTPRARALVDGPAMASCWRVRDATWPLLTAAVRHLRLEVGPDGPRRANADEVANLLLSALLVRLAPPAAQDQRADEVFDRFRTLVEQDFRQHHDVGHYARPPGYDPRTLGLLHELVTVVRPPGQRSGS